MPVTVTLAQVAKYAQVQRPSVSNWRRRHVDFPAAIGGTTAKPLFDADAVAEWLDQRPATTQPGDRAATYGDLFRAGLRCGAPTETGLDGDTFAEVALRLTALRAAYGRPLPANGDQLPRVVDEMRAADTTLAGLIDSDLEPAHATLALVDDINRLVEQLGSAGTAEQLLDSARARGWSGAQAETAPEICDLIAEVATGLLGDLSGVTIADLAAGPGRLLTRLCAAGAPKDIRFAEADPARDRWLRLRLFCHGHARLSATRTATHFRPSSRALTWSSSSAIPIRRTRPRGRSPADLGRRPSATA